MSSTQPLNNPQSSQSSSSSSSDKSDTVLCNQHCNVRNVLFKVKFEKFEKELSQLIEDVCDVKLLVGNIHEFLRMASDGDMIDVDIVHEEDEEEEDQEEDEEEEKPKKKNVANKKKKDKKN